MFKMMKVLCAGIILLLMVQVSKLIEREIFKWKPCTTWFWKVKVNPIYTLIRCICWEKSKSWSVWCFSSKFLAYVYFPLLFLALALFLYFDSISDSLFSWELDIISVPCLFLVFLEPSMSQYEVCKAQEILILARINFATSILWKCRKQRSQFWCASYLIHIL